MQDQGAALYREPFVMIFTFRRGTAAVVVNAWFSTDALDAVRDGKDYDDLPGFSYASRSDIHDMESWDNRLRDLWVDSRAPNQWVPCPPGSSRCNGFDAPCTLGAGGLVCRRTIERLYLIGDNPGDGREIPKEARPIGETTTPQLFIVAITPSHLGDYIEDVPKRDRDWVTIRWKE